MTESERQQYFLITEEQTRQFKDRNIGLMAKAATIVLEKDGFIIDGVSKFNQFVVAHKEVQYGLEVLRCLI